MSVVSVQPKDFILALFIRDDGERFLLGDNGYDFMDSQLHFAANTIENDEVEKQGADGTMLAGQVRRASVQTFDGYVGDATTPKEEIEQMRRAFIAFFLKGHHYRVIYVDCARNAWQRKGGYLVDAPEVKELFQVHPEYHVGLNFEDVNYYSYDENAEGDEITANLVQVAISSAVEGGLVWDEDGAVSEDATVVYDGDTATASGTSITVSDAVEAPLSDFKLKGETSQNGTPTPDAPVPVQTVTGENIVTISDGTNTQSYEVNLGKNLFDKDTATLGYRIGSDGSLFADGSYFVSDYIQVSPNSKYEISPAGTTSDYGSSATAYYDSSKTFISRVMGVSSGWQHISTPANCAYIRFTTNKIVIDSTQLEKGSTPTSYAAYFTPIELCKIGTYQDYIYKSGDKWYVHKEVGKITLDGSSDESIVSGGTATSGKVRFNITVSGVANIGGSEVASYSDNFVGITRNDTWNCVQGVALGQNLIQIYCEATSGYNLDQFRAWLGSHNTTVYYPLATPTDTEITNEALVAQLEVILSQGKTYAGTNNITTVIAAGNEQGELEVGYYTRYEFEITAGGYVWEEGGSGGPTTVMNESIDNVYPIWTITGPITNPVLENTTTGEQIEYVGTIGDGQTLVIDMGAQTALLDGLNVVANIVGEFLSLAPGSNTLIYSVDSGDKASEIGWSEIVG